MDVAVTRDDVPVISHDPFLRGGRLIRGLTAAELRAAAPAIPTLDETLALAPLGGFIFNIELKSFPDRPDYAPPPERFAAIALDAIRRAGVESRTLIQSFDFGALRAFEALAPGIPRSALFHLWLGSFVDVAERAHVRLVSPEFHLITSRKVRAAREAGIGVIAWTHDLAAAMAASHRGRSVGRHHRRSRGVGGVSGRSGETLAGCGKRYMGRG